MFKQISIVVLVLSFLFLGGSVASAENCNSFCGGQYNDDTTYEMNEEFAVQGGDEDIWPYVVVDLWKNIEGVWIWRGNRHTEVYRFEIKQKYNDGAMAIKIDILSSPNSDKVISSHMSLGAARNIELRTVIQGNGFDHLLKVKAYDRNRIQCRRVCGRIQVIKGKNIVLGMVLTPADGSSDKKVFRLLRKYRDL